MMSSDRWEEISLDQRHIENVCSYTVDYDKVWANNEHNRNAKKVNTLLTNPYWFKVEVVDGFPKKKELCWHLGIIKEECR